MNMDVKFKHILPQPTELRGLPKGTTFVLAGDGHRMASSDSVSIFMRIGGPSDKLTCFAADMSYTDDIQLDKAARHYAMVACLSNGDVHFMDLATKVHYVGQDRPVTFAVFTP